MHEDTPPLLSHLLVSKDSIQQIQKSLLELAAAHPEETATLACDIAMDDDLTREYMHSLNVYEELAEEVRTDEYWDMMIGNRMRQIEARLQEDPMFGVVQFWRERNMLTALSTRQRFKRIGTNAIEVDFGDNS